MSEREPTWEEMRACATLARVLQRPNWAVDPAMLDEMLRAAAVLCHMTVEAVLAMEPTRTFELLEKAMAEHRRRVDHMTHTAEMAAMVRAALDGKGEDDAQTPRHKA